ncbi:MAG: hypothetical protein ACTSWM_04495 [Alphaproteobacteria bacterium]
MRRIRTLALLISATILLAACYLPTQFTADIKISRSGDYTVDYVGRIASAPLLTAIRTTNIDPEDERERVDGVLADLGRDSGFKDIKYIGGGIFEVRYHRTGNLERQPAVTFIRNDSQIITITYVRTSGSVTVRGGTVPISAKDRVRALNLNISGVFRVHTLLPVKSHNADVVSQGELTTYAWSISGLDGTPPKLVIQ